MERRLFLSFLLLFAFPHGCILSVFLPFCSIVSLFFFLFSGLLLLLQSERFSNDAEYFELQAVYILSPFAMRSQAPPLLTGILLEKFILLSICEAETRDRMFFQEASFCSNCLTACQIWEDR